MKRMKRLINCIEEHEQVRIVSVVRVDIDNNLNRLILDYPDEYLDEEICEECIFHIDQNSMSSVDKQHHEFDWLMRMYREYQSH